MLTSLIRGPVRGLRLDTSRISRRNFLTAASGTGVALISLLAEQPHDPLNVFTPRQLIASPDVSEIHPTAEAAQVLEAAMDPDWTLSVSRGSTSIQFSASDLHRFPTFEVIKPVICLECGREMTRWNGVRLYDLIAAVGAGTSKQLRITSLAKTGTHPVALIDANQLRNENALVALEVDGAPLDINHGYPARLIASGAFESLETKWLSSIEALS